jgi:sec-independent protein translocase protein TatA
LFNGIGGSEIILVLLVILLLFGSKRIPGFSRALGRGMSEFRRAMKEIREEIESEPLETPPPPPAEDPYAESRSEDKPPPAG